MITVGFNKVFVNNNIALGNHMFQYAICRLVSMKKNYNFYIPYSGYLKDCFPEIDLGLKDGDPLFNYFEDTTRQDYKTEIFEVPDFTNLSGYFQTEKYFSGYEDMVKSWFKVESNDFVQNITEKYPYEEYCYIHIRGGDNKFGNNNWLIPKQFYLDSMNEIKKNKSEISFVIVTDDVIFAKELFPYLDVIEHGEKSEIEIAMDDFRLLYFSKYCIISASTFSWWAAWLSDKKITIAPNNWLNYNMPDAGFYPVDIKSKKFIYV